MFEDWLLINSPIYGHAFINWQPDGERVLILEKDMPWELTSEDD